MVWLCSDWQLDWDAISSVATAIGTLVALATAAYAVRLERKRDREIAAERQHQTSILAVAFDHELHMLEGMLSVIVQAIDGSPNKRTALLNVIEGTHRISFPLLERFADKFAAFEKDAATRLTIVLSSALQAKLNAPPSALAELDQLPDHMVEGMVQHARGQATALITKVQEARKAIRPDMERVARLRPMAGESKA
jgi:hypothetical protein